MTDLQPPLEAYFISLLVTQAVFKGYRKRIPDDAEAREPDASVTSAASVRSGFALRFFLRVSVPPW
jgi:hypothetical protein